MADDRPVLRSRFATIREWDEWTNATCPPATSDDLSILAGQTGPFPRRRASREEMIAFVAEQNARAARGRDE